MILSILIGIAIGAVIGYLFAESKAKALSGKLSTLSEQLKQKDAEFIQVNTNLQREIGLRSRYEAEAARIPDLEQEIKQLRIFEKQLAESETARIKDLEKMDERLTWVNNAKEELTNAFGELSRQALKENNSDFLTLAKSELVLHQNSAKNDLEKRQQSISELVNPMKESLEKVDNYIQEMERTRVGAYQSLSQQVTSLLTETTKLSRAMHSSTTRGHWGEIQLKRVVEMAGMLEHCDFSQQESKSTEDGRLRPDLIVKLPGGKSIIVDSKAPLSEYLAAMDATDEVVRAEKLALHSKQIRGHITALGRKNYWEQFDPAPEFVVLFLPGESVFTAALQFDPSLIEFGVNERVIPASPTTLIALLRSVAYGWRQENLAENAANISKLGKDLYESISILTKNLNAIGKSLNSAVDSFNAARSSIESRMLVRARRFKELGASTPGKEIEEVPIIEKRSQMIQSEELFELE
jgi:DNA recombination protein RmuC